MSLSQDGSHYIYIFFFCQSQLCDIWLCSLFPAIQDDERLTAEQMDERRRQNIAYEYLCHLEEAKRWD